MKLRALSGLVLVLLAAGGSPVSAEIIEADSVIAAVTVFPDRATVTRRLEAKVPAGAHELRLAPLPGSVDPNSVTVKGTSDSGVRIFGVRVGALQRETVQHPRAAEIDEEIRKLQQEQQQRNDTRMVLEQERKYLFSIQAASSDQIGKDIVTKTPDVNAAAALLQFLDEALQKTFAREREAQAQLEELARALDRLHRERAQLVQEHPMQQTAVFVNIEAEHSGQVELDVDYRVAEATWEPTYEARTQSGASEVELVTFGVVRHRTGENWDKAELTLSTARPALAATMPELQPWFLRPFQPMPASRNTAFRADVLAGAMAPASTEAYKVADEESDARERKMIESAYATTQAQGPAVTYVLPKPATIPSDWQPHKVPIRSDKLRAELAYEATPRLVPYVFLRAKVTNVTSAVFLPGPVAVLLDGAYVTTSQLPQVAPEEEFDLFLGADERIRVERRQMKEKVEVSILPGLRGKMKSTDFAFLTTVENYTGRTAQITVYDQLPVSDREVITVESVHLSPEPAEKDPEKPGVFHWKLELLSGQKAELTMSYRVRHPVDMVVQW